MLVEVAGRASGFDSAAVRSRLERVPGVTRVALKDSRDSRASFPVESQKGFVRGDLARAVVESGWDLNELRPTAVSLEEIFLQLTAQGAEDTKPAAQVKSA